MARPAPIDAQFHRAVDLVQSLPKSGPVQTSYEEKLQLYSLYKQATEGDNTAPRPGMLDMLGRAKWDSWAKQKGLSKRDAKALYVSALLKILQRFEDRDDAARQWSQEIEAMGPLPQRASSPASSESSFHSSRASPPPDGDEERRGGAAAYDYAPPDPSLPAPDVAPNIIPPSQLTPGHRSLVNFSHNYPYSDAGASAPPLGGTHNNNSNNINNPGFGAPFSSSRPQSAFGGSAPDRDPLAGLRGRRQTAPALGHVPEQGPADARAFGAPRGNMGPVGHGFAPLPSAGGPFGGSPQATHSMRVPSAPPPPLGPGLNPGYPLARDFGTPDLPVPGNPTPYNPSPFMRPGSASTYSHVAAPLNLPATLQQIHTSLQALHERLSTLERTQAALLRRDERRHSWSWWWSKDEDELDAAELAAERDRWQNYPASSTTIRMRRKKGLTARVAWALITAVRRAVLGLGAAVVVGTIALMFMNGRSRRRLQDAWRRVRFRVIRMLQDK